MLFSIFEKGYEHKNCFRYFSDWQGCFFKYLEKGMRKKIVPGFFRFVSIQVFKYSRFKYLKKCLSKKLVRVVFQIDKYAFGDT